MLLAIYGIYRHAHMHSAGLCILDLESHAKQLGMLLLDLHRIIVYMPMGSVIHHNLLTDYMYVQQMKTHVNEDCAMVRRTCRYQIVGCKFEVSA